MTDFVRARSEEQKQARMAEIKAAADSLFNSVPYQEITLSTIAGKLSWTRANLYKYVTTKEEIYLEICSDKMIFSPLSRKGKHGLRTSGLAAGPMS